MLFVCVLYSFQKGILRNPNKLPRRGFEGTDLATAFLFPLGGFLRNPNKLPLAPCANPFTLNLT